MDVRNLARVFGPTLVGHAVPDPDPMTILNDTSRQPKVKWRLGLHWGVQNRLSNFNLKCWILPPPPRLLSACSVFPANTGTSLLIQIILAWTMFPRLQIKKVTLTRNIEYCHTHFVCCCKPRTYQILVSILGPLTTPEQQKMVKTPSSSSLSQRVMHTLSNTTL